MKTETQKNVSKYYRRARSPAPHKKRTDFSLFPSSSFSPQSNSEEGPKSEWKDNSEGLSDSPVTISNGKLDVSDSCIKLVESISSETLPDSSDNSDSPMAVESTSEKLQDLQYNGVCTTSKSSVCSETASKMSRAAKATKSRVHKKSLKQLFSSQDVASTSNKKANCGSSNSSRTKGDSLDSDMGHKNKKSSEVHHPASSAKADRRLRIMRRLGLAPPIGSPY